MDNFVLNLKMSQAVVLLLRCPREDEKPEALVENTPDTRFTQVSIAL